MWDLGYSAVVLAGGVTLIAEATRQFSVPIDVHAHDRFPVLRGLDISSLCTPSEYLRGFIIYVIVYLAAYFSFLISAELFELLKASQSGQMVVGATGDVQVADDDESLFSIDGYGRPIFISAAIIFALSSGVFSPIERYTRSFAHRLAGIPRGVYRIIGRLKRIEYSEIAQDYPAPFSQSYAQEIAANQDNALAKSMIGETRNALLTIDILSPAVTGQLGERIFTQESINSVHSLIQTERESVEALTQRLSALPDNPGTLEDFHKQVLDTRDNLQALFAVLFIQSRSIAAPSITTPIGRLISLLRDRQTDPIVQSLTGATILTFVVTIFVATTIDLVYAYVAFEQSSFLKMVSAEIRISAATGLSVAARMSLLILATAALAVIVRETRIDSGHWGEYSINRLPFLQFCLAAVFPGFAAVLACFIGDIGDKTLQLLIINGVFITSGQIVDSIRYGGVFYGMCFGWGILIAFFIFLVADLHGRLRARSTVAIGAVMFVLFALWALLAVLVGYGGGSDDLWVARAIRDTVSFSLPAFVFFISFSLLIEWSEE